MDARWLLFLPASLRDRLSGRHNLQAIIGNSGWLFLDKIVRLGVGLLVGVWVARYLGPDKFGQLNFVTAFVLLFTSLATLGLDGIVVRELVRHPQQRPLILGSAFSLKLLGGLVAVVVVQVAIWSLRGGDTLSQWMVAIISGTLVFQAFDAFDFWFQSQVKSRFTVYVRNVAFLIVSIVKIVLVLGHANLLAFAWAALAEIVISGIGLALMYARTGGVAVNHRVILWNWTKMRELLSVSWPLFLSGLAVMVYFRIDQVMLAQLVGERQVGLYSAALRLSEVWYAIPTVLVASIAPSLIEAHTKSNDLYYRRLQQLFTYLARAAYLVAIPTTLFAWYFVPLLYGNEFAQAAPILAIHIWTSLFVFLGVGQNPWMINEGMTRFSLFQTSIGAIVNVMLNIVLIPKFGGVGAAVATLVAQILTTYITLGIRKKTRRIFKMETRAICLRS